MVYLDTPIVRRLHSTVHDDTGQPLGRVTDARFIIDGTPGQLLADARLAGLIICPHTGSSFLGYERTTARHPALIAQLLRWRHRGTFLVVWDDIAKLDDGIITLRAGHQRLSPAVDPH